MCACVYAVGTMLVFVAMQVDLMAKVAIGGELATDAVSNVLINGEGSQVVEIITQDGQDDKEITLAYSSLVKPQLSMYSASNSVYGTAGCPRWRFDSSSCLDLTCVPMISVSLRATKSRSLDCKDREL